MDTVPEIIDLSKVVEPHLNGGQLVSYSCRYLTKPGDNYGSLMIAVSAKIRQPNGTIEEMPLVAKLPPLTNEMFWAVFKPEITALRENAVYLHVAPSLRQLQLYAGVPEEDLIDVFAKSYGCRISLDENASKLDRNAVLVLENLQTSGYKAGTRQVMFDYEHTKVVLKYAAKYHALPIAMRKLQPEKYDREIRPHFNRFNLGKDMDPVIAKQFEDLMFLEIDMAMGDDIKTAQRFKELDAYFKQYIEADEECEDGLFSTLAHFDMWINNVMFSYDQNGAPIKLKIVDFQIVQYESLVHDLIFLLFTSVDTSVLDNHYYDLLKYYYDEFIDCLETVKCDTKEYSFHKFMVEVYRIAPVQISHAVGMSRVLLADAKGMPEDFQDMSFDRLSSCSPALLVKLRQIARLSKKYRFFW